MYRPIKSMQKRLLCSCVPLVLLLLLQGATVDAEDEDSTNFACPELHGSRVCAVAGSEGLVYYDGCIQVRCLKDGLWDSSWGRCRPPNSPVERSFCLDVARDVILQRLGPFECANIQPAISICATRTESLYYFDGCSSIGCYEGKVDRITKRDCPAGDPAGAYCQLVAEHIYDYRSGPISSNRRRRSQQEYACPDLAPSAICKRSTNGFSYSDGCNSIRCHGIGRGQSTMKFCPAPEESDQVGQAYCQQAEREMRAKMKRASLRSQCLTPEAACQGPEVSQIRYYDGCNQCHCMKVGESACSRRGCSSVLMTDEEFADYCQERGAGVH